MLHSEFTEFLWLDHKGSIRGKKRNIPSPPCLCIHELAGKAVSVLTPCNGITERRMKEVFENHVCVGIVRMPILSC